MSLKDCPKCWDHPCTCGYEYPDLNPDDVRDNIDKVLEDHGFNHCPATIESYLKEEIERKK